MKLDRRTFAGTMLLGAGAAITGLAEADAAPTEAAGLRATLVVDAAGGRVLHRSGPCGTRFSPCSTFKIPLALMGFDSGILKDAHHPAWDYDPARDVAHRAVERARTDPTRWEADSVVWYSQQLTRQLGMARFQSYVDQFAYGNRDLRGGLTRAWLGSSLAISPDEQVGFLRRMLAHRLASPAAHAKTEAIIPQFAGTGGWRVHGKTGSGALADGRLLGWFVGWADRRGHGVVFARFGAGAGMSDAGGKQMREAMLAEIDALAGV